MYMENNMNFSANLSNKQNDKHLNQLNKSADKHRVKKIIAFLIGLLLAGSVASVYYKSTHSHQVKAVESANKITDKNKQDQKQIDNSLVLNKVLQANGLHDKIQVLKNALASSSSASSNLINASNSPNNTRFNGMNGGLDPNKNKSLQSISLNNKQMGIDSPVSFTVGTDSQSASLSGQDLGLNFPLTIGAQYSRLGGYTVQGKLAHNLGFNNAYALGLELGNKQQRYSATLGHVLSAQQRIKFTTEYLKQDLNFDFDSGTVDQWVGQWAYGLAYQYIVPKGLVNDINLKLNYSKADSKDLGTIDTLASTGDVISSDYRRIAGATDKNVGVGVDLVPTSTSLLGLELDYDSVKYDTKYVTGKNVSGLGGKVSLEQLINKYLKVKVSASNRKPNNDYEAELDWLVSAKPSSRLEMGVTGGFTSNSTAGSTLASDSRVGLNLNYTMGSNPLAPETFYSVDNSRKALDNLVQWTSVPAVYMMQVLAIKDELVSKLNYVKPGFGPTAGGTAVTLIGENIGDEGVPGVLFGGVAAVGVTKADNNKINLNTPAHAAGIVDVTMTKPTSGQVLKMSGAFEYVDAPNLPSIGLVGGNSIITVNTVVGSNRLKDSLPQVTLYDPYKNKSVSATVISADQGKVTFKTPDATPNGYDLTTGQPLDIKVDGIKRSTFTYFDITSIFDKTTGILKVVPKDHELVQGLFAKTAELDIGAASESTAYTSASGELKIAPDGTYITLSLFEPAVKSNLKKKVSGNLVIPAKVINLQGQSLSQADYAVTDFKYEMLPVILSVKPLLRLVSGKDREVDLSGYSFDSGSKACVDGDHCSATSATDSDVKFNISKSDTGATKSVKIYVEDSIGAKSGEKTFDYADIQSDATHKAAKDEAVTINAVTASGASAKGVFNGTPKVNFYNDAVGQELIGTVASIAVTADKDGVTFRMPELNVDKVNGEKVVYVQVVNGDTIDESSLKPFTYTYVNPNITNVDPAARLYDGADTTISLTGTNFVTGAKVWKVGAATPYDTTFSSSTTLNFAMPKGTVGTVNFYVKNPTGAQSTPATFTYADIQGGQTLSYGPGATIKAVDASGTTTVSGVFTSKETTVIKFYHNDQTPFIGFDTAGTPNGDGSAVTFSMPNLPVNANEQNLPIYVQVVNGGGDKTALKSFVYNYNSPIINTVTPPARLLGGDDETIALVGDYFANGATVCVDNLTPCYTATVTDARNLTFSMPASATVKLANIYVKNSNGAKSATTAFAYADIQSDAKGTQGQTDATITAVGASGKKVFGGLPTINFSKDDGSSIGTAKATSVSTDGNTITFKMPDLKVTAQAGAVLPVHVQVINGNGIDKSSIQPFAYTYSYPIINDITPPARLVNGDSLTTINGSGFVTGTSGATVVFAEEPGTSLAIQRLETNQIIVHTLAHNAGSSFKFKVVNPGGAAATSTDAQKISYADIAVPTGEAAVSGDANFIITAPDAAFRKDHVKVTFNGTEATGISVSDTGDKITCKVPNIVNPSPATVAVKVTNLNADGSDADYSNPITVNYYAAPTITSIAPPVRLVDGDLLVKLTGTGFVTGTDITNSSRVYFNDATTPLTTGVTIVSSTEIDVTTPAVLVGGNVNIVVGNPGSTAKSPAKQLAYKGIVTPSKTAFNGESFTINSVDAAAVFKVAAHISVKFNDVVVPASDITSDGKVITCKVPSLGTATLQNVIVEVANLDDTDATKILDKARVTDITYYVGRPTITDVKRFDASPALVLNGGGALPGAAPIVVTGTTLSSIDKVEIGDGKSPEAYTDLKTGTGNWTYDTASQKIKITGIPTGNYTPDLTVHLRFHNELDGTYIQPADSTNSQVKYKALNYTFTPSEGDALTDKTAARLDGNDKIAIAGLSGFALDSTAGLYVGGTSATKQSDMNYLTPEHAYADAAPVILYNGAKDNNNEHATAVSSIKYHRVYLQCAVPNANWNITDAKGKIFNMLNHEGQSPAEYGTDSNFSWASDQGDPSYPNPTRFACGYKYQLKKDYVVNLAEQYTASTIKDAKFLNVDPSAPYRCSSNGSSSCKYYYTIN